MSSSEVYLDNGATTRLDPRVAEYMRLVREKLPGNASSLHRPGVVAARATERARLVLARELEVEPDEIVFTAGGTESNNAALKGIAWANRHGGDHIITSAIEHPSVFQTARWLEGQGFEVTWLTVDSQGFVDPADVARSIRKGTLLVSVMHANNEIGTLEPIEEIGAVCRRAGVPFHTDACQSFTRARLKPHRQLVDLASLSAHKLHGPPGVGALFVRSGLRVTPLLHGGGQERSLRSGTVNSEGIAGFGKAVELTGPEEVSHMIELRDHFVARVRKLVGGVTLNGPATLRLCNNINLMFDAVDGKALAFHLDRRGIAVSTGSACFSTKKTASRVLLAAGIPEARAHQAVRLSLGRWTTREELDWVVDAIADCVRDQREAA